MDTNSAEWLREPDEAADGVELFRPPGSQLQYDKTRDQAEASGWIPPGQAADRLRGNKLDRARIRRSELREAMEQLEAVVAAASSADGWVDSVDASMRQVRIALARHINEVESPDGLLSEILDATPRLAPDINAIKKEHGELVRSAARVFKLFDVDGRARQPLIRQAVLSLLGDLALHRQHGSDLVYDAYHVDIAAGD